MRAKVWTALAVLTNASIVAAQIPTSSAEVRPRADDRALVEGSTELKRIGACVVKRNRTQSVVMLQSLPASYEEGRIGGAMLKVAENCMSLEHNAMRVQYAGLRGALAEALFLQAVPSPAALASLDHSDQSLPKEWVAQKLDRDELVAVMGHDFAQCVVAKDPQGSATTLLTTPRSVGERTAINRLAPLFGPCLAQGQTFSMDTASIRALLAQALYRGIQVWKPVAASPN